MPENTDRRMGSARSHAAIQCKREHSSQGTPAWAHPCPRTFLAAAIRSRAQRSFAGADLRECSRAFFARRAACSGRPVTKAASKFGLRHGYACL